MGRQYISVERSGGYFLVRELKDGKEMLRREKITPVVFKATSKKTEWKDFYGKVNLDEKWLDGTGDLSKFLEKNQEWRDEIFGCSDLVSQYLWHSQYDEKDTSKLLVSYLDIEVCTRYKAGDEWVDGGFPEARDARFPVNAICDYRSDDQTYHVFTTAAGWTKEGSRLKYADQVNYVYCRNENELLRKWLQFWMSKPPHIVTGWNVKTFDIPYIVNRLTNLFGEKAASAVSPWKKITEREEKNAFGNGVPYYSVAGISILDYLDLYKKYRFVPREKFTLDFISRCENPDEAKLHFQGTHGSLYYDDPVFFVDYNIQDVRCVVCFERDLQFISLAAYLSYFAGVNFEDNYSPVKVWETLIYRKAMENHLVVPWKFKDREIKKESYEGAYVHPPVPGLKKCIASFDFTSLYPSIMRLWHTGDDVHFKGQERERLKQGLMKVLEENAECRPMLEEIAKTGTFTDFYIQNDMPKPVTEWLRREQVSLSMNCEFFDVARNSVMTDLISTLFKERKADKKESFRLKHLAQDCRDELARRGIEV